MLKEQLNREMNIEVPDGFHVMSDEEMQKLNVPDGMPGWCVSDPDRHIMMIISWKKSAFASLLINSQEVIRKSEASVRKAMGPSNYTLDGFHTMDAGGVPAEGFRYSYTVGETGMTGDVLSVKKGKVFYYIYFYMRTALLEESLPVEEEIMRSVSW